MEEGIIETELYSCVIFLPGATLKKLEEKAPNGNLQAYLISEIIKLTGD